MKKIIIMIVISIFIFITKSFSQTVVVGHVFCEVVELPIRVAMTDSINVTSNIFIADSNNLYFQTETLMVENISKNKIQRKREEIVVNYN